MPKTIEARGCAIPCDSLANPKRVFANKPKTILAGKPTIIYTNTNVKPVGKPKVIFAINPRIITPGMDTFSLPKTIAAIDQPFLAGTQEVKIAKEVFTKDQNPYSFSSFTKLQGLNDNSVRCMLVDQLGNLWLGTDGGGVSKFDGYSFSHFTVKSGLRNNIVRCIIQDKCGDLWFGTDGGGVSKYDGKYFTNYTKKVGLSNNRIYSILQDKSGNIWIGTYGGGVSKFDGKSFTNYTMKEGLSSNIVWSIYEDKNGNLWFGTYGGGVSKFNGKSFTNYTIKEGLSNNFVWSIIEDNYGNFWFGTDGGGVSKFDGKSFINYSEKEGLNNNRIYKILLATNGDIWFGTYGGGVSKYDGTTFTSFTEKEGLNNNFVFSILEDKSGSLWFGTDGGGLSKFSGKLFSHFSVKEGLSNNLVLSILKDTHGNIWFGTDGGGVSSYDGKCFTHFTEKEGLSNNIVLGIMQDHIGNLWFSTYGGGVSKYDGKHFSHYTKKEGLISNYIRCTFQDKSGNIWFGSDDGILKFDGKYFTHFNEKDKLSNYGITCIIQDKSDNIWFGTVGGGAIKYNGSCFTRYSNFGGLSSNYITSILQDRDGNIWFGTDGGGISRYDGKCFTHFTEKEGLSSNYVTSILQDTQGNLWLGNRFGLNKITPENLAKYNLRADKGFSEISHPSLFKNFTYEDGFLGIGCNRGAICEGKNGTIWIGANQKLTAYHSQGDETDTLPPNMQLTRIELFNENVPWVDFEQKKDTSIILGNGVTVGGFHFEGTSKWYGLPNNLSLKYNNNFLTFRFIGITQHQSKKVKYQYKLEGLDDNWSAPSLLNEASYGNLPHGSYTFSVKAMNSDGYWSNEYSYKFTIRPPWWKTLWFKFLMGILIVSSLFGFYRWRVATLRRQKIELKRIVKEKTKEVVLQKEELETVNEELTATNEELYYQREEILKQSELLQQQNEKLKEMDRFKQAMTSMIVHDLKNPLNLILNISKSIRPEKQIATMKQSGKQMLNMVLNILDVHKYEEVEMNLELEGKQLTLIAINAINQVHFLCEQKDITVKNEIEFELITKVEAETIERVFINLLTNAIKYTPTGGIIVISSNQLTDKMVRIGVTDTGEGIAEDGMHLVFQKFGQITAKQSGTIKATGLGLTFCKMAVEAHGGEIGLISEVGKGTTFWFTLQLGRADQLKLQAAVSNKAEEIETIMFTEEERPMLEPIIIRLKRFTVYETDDIEEIITELRECKSDNIQKWISQITRNLATLNQSRFLELLNI